jgi:protein-tyrosine kinase
VLSAIYGSRRPRRPPNSLEQHRAKRRSRPFRLAELGAWAARKPKNAAVVAPLTRSIANVPLVVRASAILDQSDDLMWAGRLPIDWVALKAASHPDPRHPGDPLMGQLNASAAPLVRQAFAADAGRRDRIVLVTSPGPAEGRTFIAISLALSLARAHPVLLVDADPGTTGTAARLGLTAAKGLSDALADPSLGPDRLIVRTELDRLALLGPGAPRADLLNLIASRRTVDLLHALLAEDSGRLLVIDAPPLCRPAAPALALFAGQVLLVVAAGRTSRGAVRTALARLGERPHVNLLLNHAPVARGGAASAARAAYLQPG